MKKLTIISIITATSLLGANISFNDANTNYNRINPANDANTVLSFNSSIAKAKKSVVNISTSKTLKVQQGVNSLMDDPFFQEFFGFHFKLPKERNQKSTSLGSGVIISKDGYIVTNYHVVEDAEEIIVTLLDNSKEYKAKIIGSDPKTDLAIIKVDAKNFEAISFGDSSKALEGDIVFAIGNPFGVGGSISQGIISGLNKDNIGLNQYEDFIQTDASINPGNSGGALVDSRGALLGINSAILSRSGGNNGIGFAIPSNMVKTIAQKLITDGKISRGYIGVMISNLTDDQKEIYKSKKGALISNVEKDKPADKAGLKRGDLIIKIDDQNVENATDLKNIIGSLAPNKEIKVTYERAGQNSTTELKLIDMDNTSAVKKNDYSSDGLTLKNLSDDVRAKNQIPKDIKGIIIAEVAPNSNAANAGFEVGDVIIQVNETTINSIDDYVKELKNSRKQDRKLMIWINRLGVLMGLVLK
ncbi:periplasmic heat shock serine protease HtrA, Do family [Campylobacter iguaniorum]|uniref:Do family serine endopeptidase n=1 Tax=Campylobacter iguaniorum TaxID=1244531 RepID=UPI00073A2D9D|nr:Do family serine endopeptidase [Campylobacter iguaniorum]ALV24770.1 periplasmic heat shock serine protease HtrA, Do family [Campylobacter iguaniorum]